MENSVFLIDCVVQNTDEIRLLSLWPTIMTLVCGLGCGDGHQTEQSDVILKTIISETVHQIAFQFEFTYLTKISCISDFEPK